MAIRQALSWIVLGTHVLGVCAVTLDDHATAVLATHSHMATAPRGGVASRAPVLRSRSAEEVATQGAVRPRSATLRGATSLTRRVERTPIVAAASPPRTTRQPALILRI